MFNVYGLLFMVYRLWFMVYGLLFTDLKSSKEERLLSSISFYLLLSPFIFFYLLVSGYRSQVRKVIFNSQLSTLN